MNKLKTILGSLAIAGLLGSTTAQADLVIVTNDIATGTTNTWVSTNEYLLNTMVYVQSNAVLNIEPGTVVKGGTNQANLIARAGLANLVSGLWVTRGGKLYATGTVSAPITFTMEGDDVNNPNDVPPTTTGKWGGIVMMGNATINSAQFAAGQAASPKYDVYEGVATVPSPQTEHIFGGNDDSDSSGALRYVSIRHTGNTFAPGKELNGLTMGGVGSGTDISYVEVLASSDDGFEWWGGTVNTHHLVGAFNEDDDFDTDQGYRGTNQFWFAIKPPWAGSSDSRAIESDGDLNQTVVGDALPFSQWTVYNATLIGRGKGDVLDLGGNQGWNARDEAAPNVINTVVAEFNNGLLLDNDGLFHWTNTTVRAGTLNCVWDNGTAGNANGLLFITNVANNHYVGAALLGGISYTNGTLNPRPLSTSPALTGPALAGAPVAAPYRGAFSGINDTWADGWTAVSTEGYLATGGSKPTIVITNDIAAGTTNTWSSDAEYLLNTMVYVQSNAVLNIEPGTVVKGGTNQANLIARAGLANLVSGLWVTRGGKLYATGTVSAPITFTMEGDDVNNPNDVPPTTTGKWGGIVMMGNATINSAQFAAGQAASPKYDVYEGVATVPSPETEHIFGGNNDSDSSGALRYVSIRHTGNTFAPGKELNGLTMGGVGSGTDISYVEVLASSDDGFEWWGGTVNTHHLVGAFNEDDDFDTDQGYRGTNQFWFAIKPPWAGSSDSRAIESDGDLNQTVVGDALPFSQWTVYNATLIGRGKGDVLDLGGNQGWNARDEAAPNVINTVVAEFNNGLLLDNDGLFHWTNTTVRAGTLNCVWDNGTAGNANGLLFITNVANNHYVGAALLGGISYTNGTLNPRPLSTSPALTGPALAGAPVAAPYRGAFSGINDTWADGWTAVSTEGYLATGGSKPTIVITNDIAAGTTNTWSSDAEYLLNTMVYVQSNAVLNIEPGTVVKGGTNQANLIARAGLANLVSGLWVTRGGKLYATGTVSAPITFTMEGDDVNNPNDVPPTTTGKWGGIVMMGNATINSAQFAAGQAASPKYDVYEGVATVPSPETEHIFGGNNDSDSSGALRYVSIRHTGNTFAPGKELNGLTMGGVGSGTDISYVEVLASSDDGFEWWGGTVNTHHLVGAFNEDDDFDTDQGYRGTNQFWFAIKPPWAGSSDSRAIESDGDLNQTVVGDALPFSQWTVYNATLIGRGKGDVLDLGGNQGWNARDEAAPNVINTVVAEFNNGLLLDNDGLFHWTNTTVRAGTLNCVWDNGTAGNANGLLFITNVANNHYVGAALLGGISYTNGTLNPRPLSTSPALTGPALAGAPVAAPYRGAFSGINDTWADGWTAVSTEGYLATGGSKPTIVITNDIAAGTTNTWSSDAEYLLNTMVYVQSNAVLNIEPGTVVKGGTNQANLIARAGLANLVSGLWVTRGGKLYATGTVSAPITFTMEGDDVNNPNDVPPTTTGKWGGIVMMGNATINSAQFAAGQAASPKYDVYEGVATVPSPETEHIFGGNNDSDSSGALRYVSIRHTGNTFAPGKELNGLTMGGVGSGTDISYVEVLASSDDGFEWWGGTVNTHHLVGAFNEDDDFDTDQGYRGTNQFWFAIKPPWAGSSDSRAIESDGDLNQTVVGDALPFSQWTVYNATLIGRGKGDVLDLGGNQGWNARDEAAPNVINTVVAEFNNGLLLDNDGLFHWTNTTVRAGTLNCVWDNGTAGNANGLLFITNVANNHYVGAALLGGISYTNTMALDPRPQTGSPALTNALPGAPVPTTYRGAFGPNDDWASGWTALSTEGFLSTNVVVVPPSAPTITTVAGSGTLSFSITSQSGYSYVLQATPVLNPAVWANKETLPGNGGVLNFTPVVTTNGMEYFRILAQ